jgi:hypothetical protein
MPLPLPLLRLLQPPLPLNHQMPLPLPRLLQPLLPQNHPYSSSYA